jgi:hypothetical protein
MRDTIDMAREAGIIDPRDAFSEAHVQAVLQDLKTFEALVRADERRSKPHSLGPGEMELSLRRNHKDDLFECRRRFSAEEVVLGPDFLVEATAKMLDAEMNRAIRARGNT